jgi:hypothetical protein
VKHYESGADCLDCIADAPGLAAFKICNSVPKNAGKIVRKNILPSKFTCGKTWWTPQELHKLKVRGGGM